MGKKLLNGCKGKGFTGTDDEWIAIVQWSLLRRTPKAVDATVINEVETVATLQPGKELTIALRRMVSGIAVRINCLGSDIARLTCTSKG